MSQQNQEATLAALRARLIGLIGNQTMSEIIPGFLDDAKPNMDQLNHLNSQNHSTWKKLLFFNNLLPMNVIYSLSLRVLNKDQHRNAELSSLRGWQTQKQYKFKYKYFVFELFWSSEALWKPQNILT